MNLLHLRHLNKLRWLVLSLVFITLLVLPFLHLYQTYIAAHAYDLLSPGEKCIYDIMEWLTDPLVSDAETQLDNIKGNTWSATLFGYKISDPLAVLSQMSAGLTLYVPFMLTALVPVIVTLLLGRVFCGWICPATFLYELNSTLAGWLHRLGIHTGTREFDKRLKYLVLAMGIIISAVTGSVIMALIYPPAIVGRELYFAIAQGGFGAGMIFFLMTVLFDLLVARRGFCRYLCPGGALYSLLGRYRILRLRRRVETCNDCTKCNVVCEFGLDPMHDDFGQECNNCSACVAICPTDALAFTLRTHDETFQGPGHLGHDYRQQQKTAPP
jgi:ferredoxin-type protein NapH